MPKVRSQHSLRPRIALNRLDTRVTTRREEPVTARPEACAAGFLGRICDLTL